MASLGGMRRAGLTLFALVATITSAQAAASQEFCGLDAPEIGADGTRNPFLSMEMALGLSLARRACNVDIASDRAFYSAMLDHHGCAPESYITGVFNDILDTPDPAAETGLDTLMAEEKDQAALLCATLAECAFPSDYPPKNGFQGCLGN